MASARHHCPLKRCDRGFSLLELGVVIAVIAVIAAAIAAGTSGFMKAARAHRTGQEMQALVIVGQKALLRDLHKKPGASVGQAWIYFYGATKLEDAAPLCFDLAAANPDANLLALLGQAQGGKLGNGGRNAYGEPYSICMFSHRVEARTCVPQEDAITATMLNLDACANACPAKMACVAAWAAVMPRYTTRLRNSYSETLYVLDQ